jgi:hypothetical protein
MALLTVLKCMKRSDITVHGFRSTFKDWAREQTNFPNDVSEAALAHLIGDETGARLRARRSVREALQLMNAWSLFCAPAPVTNVVPLRGAAAERAPERRRASASTCSRRTLTDAFN